MAGFSDFPVIGPIIGGAVSGRGNVEANYEAKNQKKRLGWDISDIEEISNPIYNSLITGLQPGGFLRSSLAAPGIDAAFRGGADATRSAGENAYRFGGKQFGGSGSFLAGAARAPAQALQASAEGDFLANDLLARIDASIRGGPDAFPESQPENKLEGYGRLITGLSQGYGDGVYGSY